MSTIKKMLLKTFSFNSGLRCLILLTLSITMYQAKANSILSGDPKIDTLFTPYLVQDGDNLYAISRRFSVPTDLIMYANKINPDRPKIFVGTEILIPKLIIKEDKEPTTNYVTTEEDPTVDLKDTVLQNTNGLNNNLDSVSKNIEEPTAVLDTVVPQKVINYESVETTPVVIIPADTQKADIEKKKKKEKEVKPEEEVIRFDEPTKAENTNIDKAPLDTVVRKKIRQNEKVKPSKNAKTASTEFIDSSFFKRDIQLNTVKVEDSKIKKKKKYELGDQVDPVTEEKAQFFLARAMKAIDERNFSQAESYIAKSLSLNPSYTEAYLLKGDLNSTFGYYDKAVKDYDKAVISNPRIPNSFYNRGTCYLRMHEVKKAMQDFTKAINLDSTYILAIGGRASLLMMDKEYYQAIDDYSRIISLNKFFSPAYKARGVARLEIGDYTGSLEDFDQYLKSEPKDAYVLYERGMAKLKTGKLYESCIDLLTASELGSEEAKAALKKHCK